MILLYHFFACTYSSKDFSEVSKVFLNLVIGSKMCSDSDHSNANKIILCLVKKHHSLLFSHSIYNTASANEDICL